MTSAPPRIPLWIDLRDVPINKRLSHLKAAADANAEGVLLHRGDPHLTRPGVPAISVASDGQLRRRSKRIGRLLLVRDAASQDSARKAKGIVVADGKSWKVIPLENLIAARQSKPGTLYALARSLAEVRLFAGTLETGPHGIVFVPQQPADIQAADRFLRHSGAGASRPSSMAMRQPELAPVPAAKTPGPATRAAIQFELKPARIERITDAGLGERVLVDTTSLLHPGEGLLVGSTARGFALVHAETATSALIAARPFRVNAGALHMYNLAPGGTTCYLSEWRAGDEVLVVSRTGNARKATVGRCKIERRPHTLIEWSQGTTKGSAILQTAETVALLRPDGSRIAITELQVGDQILVHTETAARHTGLPVSSAMEER